MHRIPKVCDVQPIPIVRAGARRAEHVATVLLDRAADEIHLQFAIAQNWSILRLVRSDYVIVDGMARQCGRKSKSGRRLRITGIEEPASVASPRNPGKTNPLQSIGDVLHRAEIPN